MSNSNSSINSVILLRGIAALLVCVVHIGSISNLHISKLTDFIINNGQQGVPVFFIISGFILPYALYKKKYEIKDFFNFLLRRSLRIDPPYWCTIIFLFLIKFVPLTFLTPVNIIFHLFYLVPFIKGSLWYCNVFWTLSIEFQFYILLGIFFPILNNINKNLSIIYLLTIAVALILLGFTVRGIIISNFYDFAIGYILFLGFTEQISKQKTILIVMGFSIFIILKVSIITGSVSLLTSLFMLFYNVKKLPLVLGFTGKISYSLYLIHTPVSFFVEKMIHPYLSDPYLLFILCFVVSITIAYLLYLIIEKPAMDFSKTVKLKKQDPSFA